MSQPETVYVKRTTCRSCGGPKVTRPKTGYVYCDYCATLTDWDFQVAISTPTSAPPGPQYEILTAQLKPELDAAREAQDRPRYYRVQCMLYDLYVKLCPAAVPPRASDPAYRAAWIDYTAKTTTEQDLDPETAARTGAMNEAVTRLAWTSAGGAMQVTTATFWPMWDTVVAKIQRSLDLNARSGLLAQHPDGAPAELLLRMGLSAMVQGWLPYLGAADSERLLAVSGMKGDYVAVAPPPATLSQCGGCGGELHVVQGASRVVCESCGRLNEQRDGAITCPTCGGHVPLGATNMTACPFCRADLRTMRHFR